MESDIFALKHAKFKVDQTQFDSLLPSDAIWNQISRSTLDPLEQVIPYKAKP